MSTLLLDLKELAGFESIFDSQETSSDQDLFVDSWDDCHDCDYNCDGER